jgi:hypothetical protein
MTLRNRAQPQRQDVGEFLPTTAQEMRDRGWEAADIVFVSGDAYIDHPSFAAAILGRWLEKHGFRVAILAQPDWQSAAAWRALGPPRLFYAVSAGNMDSMINHYTANRKRRNSDAYSPGGQIGLRPDRATAVYAQRCREAFKNVPIVTGGVEASLRRVARAGDSQREGPRRPRVLPALPRGRDRQASVWRRRVGPLRHSGGSRGTGGDEGRATDYSADCEPR